MTTSPLPGAPRALIVLHSPGWVGIARLPRALAQAGFEVASLSPAGSFLSLTRFNRHHFTLSEGQLPVQALEAAVRQFQPDLLVPGCDAAVHHLLLIARAVEQGRWPDPGSPLPALVQRSLGGAGIRHNRLSKSDNLALGTRLGLRTPEQWPVADLAQAREISAKLGWPVVLKGEYGSAGSTVRICADAPSLSQAFELLQAQAPGMRLVLQAFVRGQGAICAGVAMAGQVLESVGCLKLHVHPSPTSPSSVLRVVDEPGMRDALARLVQAMGLSGWCEAEFILEPGARAPCLIELNPRPSPLSALGGLWGHDLALALAAHLRGQAYRRPAPLTPRDTVALFPNEWARDPHSPHLRQGHHDVPHDDPALLRALWRSVGVTAQARV